MLRVQIDGKLVNKVTKDEADAYNPLSPEPPCNADDFKLYLEGTPAHPWNKAATRVFVESFSAKFSRHLADEAEEHFKVHLDTLIRKYKAQVRSEGTSGVKDEAKKRNRMNTRKATVSPSLFRTKGPRY
jgi:hypothetical protein